MLEDSSNKALKASNQQSEDDGDEDEDSEDAAGYDS